MDNIFEISHYLEQPYNISIIGNEKSNISYYINDIIKKLIVIHKFEYILIFTEKYNSYENIDNIDIYNKIDYEMIQYIIKMAKENKTKFYIIVIDYILGDIYYDKTLYDLMKNGKKYNIYFIYSTNPKYRLRGDIRTNMNYICILSNYNRDEQWKIFMDYCDIFDNFEDLQYEINNTFIINNINIKNKENKLLPIIHYCI